MKLKSVLRSGCIIPLIIQTDTNPIEFNKYIADFSNIFKPVIFYTNYGTVINCNKVEINAKGKRKRNFKQLKMKNVLKLMNSFSNELWIRFLASKY